MDVIAKLRFLRIAPRKVRLVLDLIRGQSVAAAQAQLMNLPKASSRPLLKLLKSAEANAENNFKLDLKTLFIKQAFADEGPKIKRFTPRAMGRATPIFKRSSHVTVILAERVKNDGSAKDKTTLPKTALEAVKKSSAKVRRPMAHLKKSTDRKGSQ